MRDLFARCSEQQEQENRRPVARARGMVFLIPPTQSCTVRDPERSGNSKPLQDEVRK